MLQETGLNRACVVKMVDAISTARQLIKDAGLDHIASCHMSRLLPLVADLVSARDAQTEVASHLRLDLVRAQAEFDAGVSGINRGLDLIRKATRLRKDGTDSTGARAIPISDLHGSNGPLPIDRALDDVARYSAARREEQPGDASWAAEERMALQRGVVALGDTFAMSDDSRFGPDR